MIRKFESLEELKRSIYLWVIPCIIIALISNTLLQNFATKNFHYYLNITLAVWFIISWALIFKNRFMRFTDYSNLLLLSFYHITTFYDAVRNYMVVSGGSLGDFIIWMPLITIFFFLTLGTKRGLFFSIGIFLTTFVTGVMYINNLSSESVDSIGQYYFANLVYIIVLYYAQHIFRTYADLEMFKKYAYVDTLTRVASRLLIDQWLEEKLKAFKEKNEHFSIIFFDIDHFKNVNDNYGHKVGDAVLVELAELIQGHLTNRELFGRWGGEEFIIITPERGENTLELATHLRSIVEAHEFKDAGKITASFGVTCSQPEDDIDSLLNRADKGLYRSKDCGRNCVSYSN